MLTVCPHCYGKVLLKSDGTCPACDQFVDENSPPPEYGMAQLRAGQKLPAICFNCGELANDFAMVKLQQAMGGDKQAGFLFLKFLLPKLFRGASAVSTFRLDVPACGKCGLLDQSDFLRGHDFASRWIQIRAHHKFIEALQIPTE